MPTAPVCSGPHVWCAALSSDGTAIATWLSDILSFAAICIALWVFLREQRRFHAEQTAGERRRVDRADAFIDAVAEIADDMKQATVVLTARSASQSDEESDRTAQQAFVRDYLNEIRIAVDALWVFRLKAPEDAGIAKCLARLQRIGEDAREIAKKNAPNILGDLLKDVPSEIDREVSALEGERLTVAARPGVKPQRDR